MGGGGRVKAVVATDWILSGAVVVGVLRDCSVEGGREGEEIGIIRSSCNVPILMNVHGIAQLFKFP